MRSHAMPIACAAAFLPLWLWAAHDPLDRHDWALEQILVGLTAAVVLATYRWRPVSNASYALLTLFVGLHVVGSHWSYSNVPGFDVGWEEHGNQYDRLVHLLFGVLLWLPARELLGRHVPGQGARTVAAVVAVFAAAAIYEVVEWVVVLVVAPGLGAEFLGAQGDPFDGIKDMALGLLGAAVAAGAWTATRPWMRREPGRQRSRTP